MSLLFGWIAMFTRPAMRLNGPAESLDDRPWEGVIDDHVHSAEALPATGSRRSRHLLDEVDRQVLDALVSDARLPIRSLAQQVHISRSSAYQRVRRLLDEGIIRGFTAVVPPSGVGLHTCAYVSISIEQGRWREISEQVRRIPYVEHVAFLAGEQDVLALVRTPDNAALRSVVLEQVQRVPGIVSTRTWVVFEELAGEAARPVWSATPDE